MKRCSSGCQKILDDSEFPAMSHSPDGLQAICRACCLVRDAQYKKDHPMRFRSYKWKYNLNKRLGKKGFDPHIVSSAECHALFDALTDHCVRCGESEDLHIDHIRPIHSHPELAFTSSNLQRLCIPCHKVKTKAEAVSS